MDHKIIKKKILPQKGFESNCSLQVDISELATYKHIYIKIGNNMIVTNLSEIM